MLPVPWQHFVVLLTPPADEAQLETYIGQRFTQVLDAMFSAEDDLAKLTDAPPRRGGTPERESSRLTAAAIMTPVLFRYHQLRESYFDKDLAIVVS